jgi:hypothetical protein
MKTLAELNQENIERAKKDRNLAFTTYPELYDWFFPKPTVVKILIVTDGTIDFGDGDFGLSELLKALSVSPGPYVSFAVMKAHRAATADQADILNFKFDNESHFKPENYDEVWLFGIATSGSSSALSDKELRIITQFMDKGGGVFAVGDHQDLGNALCARIPRVRSMRKWYFPNKGPNGEPVAPPVGIPNLDKPYDSSERNDTLREGHDSGFQFDDQSDDIPQEIIPTWYSRPQTNLDVVIKYPHPLLCGPRGVIKVLPDHMHEGECYVDEDLTQSFTFDGYTTKEYPILQKTGKPLEPEVIAAAIVIGDHKTYNPESPPTTAKIFGVLGAYDGHKVNVGRVAVDATWHHFININIRGVANGISPIKQQGFNASEKGKAVYEDIKSYWRNLGTWLAPKHSQTSMLEKALWMTRWSYPLSEELSPRMFEQGLSTEGILYTGKVARRILENMSSKCQVRQFLIYYLAPIEIIVDPWWPKPDPGPEHIFDLIINSVLGGMILSIVKEFPERNRENKERAEKELSKVVAAGVPLGIQAAQETVRISLRQMENVSSHLEKYAKIIQETSRQ